MGWMEKNEITKKVLQEFANEFADLLIKKYEQVIVETEHGNVHCFIADNGFYIYPVVISSEDNSVLVLAIEYAENEEAIEKAWEDEGDFFTPLDYESKEAMFEAMLKEIES